MSKEITIHENGVDIVLSNDEAKEFEKERQDLLNQIKVIDDEKAAKESFRASALAKLAEIGLTAEEIAAL